MARHEHHFQGEEGSGCATEISLFALSHHLSAVLMNLALGTQTGSRNMEDFLPPFVALFIALFAFRYFYYFGHFVIALWLCVMEFWHRWSELSAFCEGFHSSVSGKHEIDPQSRPQESVQQTISAAVAVCSLQRAGETAGLTGKHTET